jgi:hypothetical protein
VILYSGPAIIGVKPSLEIKYKKLEEKKSKSKKLKYQSMLKFTLFYFDIYILSWYEIIRILHRLSVQTGISSSRVTVYGGNEALQSFR